MQQSLQTKHEELLALDEDNHPPYINSNYLKAYKALFRSHGFCCRFKSCPASDTGFPGAKTRASHEAEHFPTYGCKECDFSVRGFRSKRDLLNHVNKYHANTENIELPAELLPSSPQSGQASPTTTFVIDDLDLDAFFNDNAEDAQDAVAAFFNNMANSNAAPTSNSSVSQDCWQISPDDPWPEDPFRIDFSDQEVLKDSNFDTFFHPDYVSN
jgi:hypothetical protein